MMKKPAVNKGFALAFSLIVMTTVILSAAAYFEVAGSGMKIAGITANARRAYYLADAGLAEAYIQLRNHTKNNSVPPLSFNVSNSTYSVGSKTGAFSVDVVDEGSSWPTYRLTSTGSYGGINKTLELRVLQASASMSAYLSNSETHPTLGRLWWITGMYTVGPVHTNGQFNIWGDPIFDGPVSQCAATVNYWPGVATDPADFRGGLTLNAKPQAVFNNAILNSISAAASSGGLALSGDSAITFNANGSMNVTNSKKKWKNKNIPAPANKAVFVQGGSATVGGTISGQVTVASDNNVYIANSLIYNSNPDPTQPNLLSNDLLALVAQNNIVVKTASTPANVVIAAVMVAINGSFQVDNYWVQGKGNMLQYGALINNVCGPTGVFDPGTGTLYGGYNQLQYFDERLDPRPEPGRVNLVPAWFPPVRDKVPSDPQGRITYKKIEFREL